MENKTCPGCGEDKPLHAFGFFEGARGQRVHARCEPCRKRKNQEHTSQVRAELDGSLKEKTCWRCKRLLPIDEFPWKKEAWRGRSGTCSGCADPNGHRRCNHCGEIKPKTEFHSRFSKGYYSYSSNCKTCSKLVLRVWRLRQHHLTLEGYFSLLDEQGGGCAICSRKPEPGDVLRVDHDHSCCAGEYSCGSCIRGLLCDRCNRGLGYFLDSYDSLVAAANYIRYRSMK